MENKMTCSVARDLLPLYADKLLSPESEEELKEHLRSCPACREICEQMTSPEPELSARTPEVDYLKKVKRGKKRLLIGAVLAVAAVAAGLFLFFTNKANQTTVSYDEASKTIVVYGKEKADDLKLPASVEEAQNLDAQFESFHVTVNLDLLRTEGESLETWLADYLNRTGQSIRFLRSYLRENCADSYPAERADKYVELTIMPKGRYAWSESEDRIVLDIGSFYWHREELYILSLLGSETVQWKQLGYVWYLGACLDPYNEVMLTTDFSAENMKNYPYAEAYRRGGGTEEATPENYRRLDDAVSWVCVTQGMKWGTSYESWPLNTSALYNCPTRLAERGDNLSVCMASSFIAWLSDNYGFDRVSAYCFGRQTFEEAFGAKYGERYDAWKAWILETYGE